MELPEFIAAKLPSRERLRPLLRIEVLAGLLMALAILGGFLFPTQFRSLLGVAEETPFGVPEYTGQPVREYREDPDEVRLFTQEQRDTLRRKLEDHAGSIDVNPDQLDPWLQAGVIKKVIGDFEGARDVWEYASLIRPKNFVSFKNLGELYWHYLPDFPRAEYNFRKAIENEPMGYDQYISLSELYRYSYTEKAALAEDVLFEGLEKNPRLARDFTAYIARFYKETDDIPKAIEYYEKLLEFEPDNADVHEELRKLRSRL